LRAASTDRKFDPTVLARPANCGGCAPIQGLQDLRAWAFCSSGRSIRNARYGKMATISAITRIGPLLHFGTWGMRADRLRTPCE